MRLGGGDAATMVAQQVDYVSRSTRCWHFCPQHMEQYSPCREDGISPAHEASLRKSYCVFMQTLGRKLRLPQLTIATAIVFCHRFFLRQSLARNDRYVIATVCLFLAGKVEETPERLHNVIVGSYEVRYAEEPDAALRIKQKEVYDEQKALLLMGERLVLVTLGFNLNVAHPYKPLIAAIKRVTLPQTHSLSQLAQIAWNFVNDGLQTLLCLQFKPCHIAAGAIYLAAKFLRIKLFCDWEELLSKEFDISHQQLEDVSNQILQSYDSLVEPSAISPGLSKLVRVAVNHTKGSAKEACTCTLQEAATVTSSVKYEEKHYLHSIQMEVSELNVEEREAILSRGRHNIRVDFDNGRSHTGHSDLTEEKEVPELLRNSQFEAEDYWEFEGNQSDEGNQYDLSSMEDVKARSTGKVWLGGRDRNSRRVGRHVSPVGPNGKERDGTLVGRDRHDPWVRVSSRERGIRKSSSRREPLGGLTSTKKDVKKFATRRNFLLWLSNKKKAALESERVHNRLKLFRRKAEILGQHSGQRSRGMKESGIRRPRYDFVS